MMRFIIALILSFVSIASFAQTQQTLGAPNTRIATKGDMSVDSIFYLPRTLVTSRSPIQAGALRYQSSDSALYQWTGTAWRKAGGGDVDTLLLSTRAWRQKGIDSLASVRIGGSGVTGYIPKFTAARTLDSSQIFQLGGNIGIGTAMPSSLYKVDVSGAIRATQANNATVQIQSTQGNAFFQLQDSSSRWQVGGSSNPPYPNGVFYVYDAKNTVNRMAIDHLGRVALGSNAPAGKLDIRQSGIVDIFMVSTTSGTQENTIQSYANNGAIWSNLDIRSNNLKLFTTTIGGTQSERMRIFENGRVGINTTTDAGFQFDVAGSMRNTTNAYFATSSGNVGIGTTSPVSKFHVVQSGFTINDGFTLSRTGANRGTIFIDSTNDNLNFTRGTNGAGTGLAINNLSRVIAYSDTYLATSSGNVGVATTSPVSRFHVVQSGNGMAHGITLSKVNTSRVSFFIDSLSNTLNITRGGDEVGAGIVLTSSGETYIGTTSDAGAFKLQVNGVAYAADGLRTGNPTGGTAATWKLGTVATVSPTSPNRTIEVDIGGTIYYIHAKTTND